MNIQSLQIVLPELILVAFALASCLLGVFGRLRNLLGAFALLGVAVSLFFIPESIKAGHGVFFSMIVNDTFSVFFRELSLIIAGIVILLSMGYKDLDEDDTGEYYFFLLTVTIAMMLAASTNNLMMIYITLESISLVSYIMAGYLKRDMFSSEAGVKYFLFGALSTGVTLYGISLLYGFLGTLDLSNVFLGAVNDPALSLALLLVLVGFGFKCSLVPFHMWTPDVYQGAPTPVAAFLSVGPKAIGFAFILRVFAPSFASPLTFWPLLTGLIAIFTMTLGNITALAQNNIKRLLAYSTIAQAGYIFIGLVVTTPLGIYATLFYIFIYALMNLGAFGAVVAVGNALKSEEIDAYAGLYKRDPVTAVTLTVLLLSLAGIPPLAGFLAKFLILAAAVEAKYTTLAVIAVVNAVIGLFYYVKVIKFMFLHEPANTAYPAQPLSLKLTLIFLALCNIALGLYPQVVMKLVAQSLHI